MVFKARIKWVLILVLLGIGNNTFSQGKEGTKALNNFSGAVTLTNNGISFIPTFSLGKPAAIFDMSVGRRLIYSFSKKYVRL